MYQGAVVKLRSGGPQMTVDALGHGGSITCIWFVEDELQVAAFPLKALIKSCMACQRCYEEEQMDSNYEMCEKCYYEYIEDIIVEQMIDRERGK